MDISKMLNWKYIALFFVFLLIVMVAANYINDYFFVKRMSNAANKTKTQDQQIEEEADKVRVQSSLA